MLARLDTFALVSYPVGMDKVRAIVRNESVDTETWFVYVERKLGATTYAARFNTAKNATDVADAMNDAYRAEGRLLIHGTTCECCGALS